MYGVHRATAARWAATARAALVAATRVRLRGDLGADLTSAMHLAGSEIRLESGDLRSATPALREFVGESDRRPSSCVYRGWSWPAGDPSALSSPPRWWR